MFRVFVYGSLLRGMENHSVLDGAEFASAARTLAQFQMLDLGRYPAVIAGGESIVGELYRVNAQHLLRLDAFERVPELYVRHKTVLDDGQSAWIYLYNTSVHDVDAFGTIPRVPEGAWVAWRLGR